MLYEQYISYNREAFIAKVQRIAYNLSMAPEWLMFVMYHESRFNPAARNPYGSATGLIQFLDSTARSLGTTTAALANMSAIEQLDYVEKYYEGVIRSYGAINNITDAYLAAFYPAAIRWNNDHEFSDAVLRVNAVFDVNDNGILTKQDFIDWVAANLPAGYEYLATENKYYIMNRLNFVIGCLLVLIGGFFMYTRPNPITLMIGILLLIMGGYLIFIYR